MFEQIKNQALSLNRKGDERPWGKSIILNTFDHPDYKDGTSMYREKFLIFNSGASIVLEKHDNYSEVWIPDQEMHYLLEDEDGHLQLLHAAKHERVVIPFGKKHKVINNNPDQLCIFEIQFGVIKKDDKIQYELEDREFQNAA